jgi:DNA-binding MurR/RpiR family transcriptional regulator
MTLESIGNNKNIIAFVKFMVPTLSNSEKKAAEYLLENTHEVLGLPLKEYAERAGSSQASIIRLCKRIGVSGYSQMKAELSMQMAIQNQISEIEIAKPGNDMATIVSNVLNINIKTLYDTMQLVTEEYDRAFEAILHAKQICFFALGDAMFPCSFINTKFRRIGYISYADVDPDMQMINACNLKKGDVAIAVSHSGNSRQVVAAMKKAHEKGATTICIIKVDKSELTKYCDIKLFTATSDATEGKEVVARRIAEQAILEALYLGVQKRMEPIASERNKEITAEMLVNKL